MCVLYLLSLNKWVWRAILLTVSEPIEQTSSFFSPSPNDLARNLILNHTLVCCYFISLEIGLVNIIFQSWHIHLLLVLIKTRDHDRLYQRYSIIKNLNHVYCLGSQQSLKNLLVLNKYLTTNPFTLVMQGSFYFKKFTP